MDKKFTPAEVEQNIYRFWEKSGLTKASKGKPYVVLMPPPNANASLHAGHGMYAVDDLMVRYKRLRGYASIWIPGLDHAGFETQYVYEKHLAKQGKSRMDFDRQTFYENVFGFVKENSGLIYSQFKRLGFLADWERSVFTLDKHVLQRVFETFEKMEKEKLVYRDDYLVNYCTHCGTSLAELEIEHVERIDPLYYMKYGPFILATVRPETKFGDTALAVNPKDKRYQQWVGKEVEAEGLLGNFKIKVIADEMVDSKFGTGVVKITPAHDFNDFETAKRHSLEIKQVIDITGRLNHLTGPYKGLKVKPARIKIAEDLEKKGLMEKVDKEYLHSVAVCYRCKRDLEPMIIPNWYIKVKDLKTPVINAVTKNKVKFFPGKFKKQMLDWMKVMHDWPISRQIAWGIRIPAWYEVGKNPQMHVIFLDSEAKTHSGFISELLKEFPLEVIEKGLQKLSAPKKADYLISEKKPQGNFLQETDTFDTWFSSGQWPLVTLKDEEYQTMFPTDLMATMKDILYLWVSRMIMFSLYIRNEVPFKQVYLWSQVTDSKGQKMSKSKGNVVNPIVLADKYGADAFRASLFFGLSSGGEIPLSEEKIIGMRNFANKIWNIGRFIEMNKSVSHSGEARSADSRIDSGQARMTLDELKKELAEEKKLYLNSMDSFKFSQAIGLVYEFIWHRYADYYIEQLKDELRAGKMEVFEILQTVFFENLKMLHPFMPFVTEAIWKVFHGENSSILKEQLTD